MGFPYEEATWDGVTGAIFMGANGGAGAYTFIAIGLCILALVIGQIAEAKKYSAHK